MKALGLHQPFAALIRLGIKTIETRFWSTPYLGPVLICSTKGSWSGAEELLETLRQSGHDVSDDVLDDIGTMQCLVDIVGCRLGTDADEPAACCWLKDINPRTGLVEQKHAILLNNVRPVVRSPVSCGRKWFNVDDSLIEVI
jgi:hypothetical protein